MTVLAERTRWTGWDLLLIYVVSQVGVALIIALSTVLGSLAGAGSRELGRLVLLLAYLVSSPFLLGVEWLWLAARKAAAQAWALYRWPGRDAVLVWGVLGGLGVKLASDVVTYVESRFVPSIEQNNPLLTDPSAFRDPLALAGLFAAVVLAAPLAEELFYRGLLFEWLRPRGFWVAAVVSSLLFAAAHVSLTLMVPLAVTGFGFAWIYAKTGSLVASTVAHAMFNGVALVATVLSISF
ncbi:MAG: CPBP family intramembrane metalloprotease [Clostridia bacterium]|nr:CPBP family intramembrane metalloprotease [Clostridia bacterium]